MIDGTYAQCIALAKESKCQKLGFGAILMDMGSVMPMVVAQAANQPIDALADMCDPECCRFYIPSRTESMLGACGHAEEACLLYVVRHRDKLPEMPYLEMYVAGVGKPDNEPLTKKHATFTCIRCATQMHLAGIRGVNVWHDERWVFIDSETALRQAKMYALQRWEVDSQ